MRSDLSSTKTHILFIDNNAVLTKAFEDNFLADGGVTFQSACVACPLQIDTAEYTRTDFDVVILDPTQARVGPAQILDALRREIDFGEAIAYLPESAAPLAHDCIKAGYSSAVSRSASPEELVDAVWAAASGGIIFDGRFGSLADDSFVPSGMENLSCREREILSGVAAGKVCREIGEELSISGKTVETHKYRGMSKLGLTSFEALADHARANSWAR